MKKIISLLLCLAFALDLCATARAEELPRVIDQAELLTANEELYLAQEIQTLWAECSLDVVLLTVNTTGGKSVQTYANDYYDEHLYGYGYDYTGLLLLVNMGTQEWYISTCGEAQYIFTDYGLEQMGQELAYHLSAGRYYDAFAAFLESIPDYCRAYDQGAPVDGYVPPDAYVPSGGEDRVHYQQTPSYAANFLIALLIGLVVATVAVLVMRSSMNTAKKQINAGNYMRQGSYVVNTHRDLYLYRRVTKTAKPQNTGGSSTHRSSGGRSHGGRGGRF